MTQRVEQALITAGVILIVIPFLTYLATGEKRTKKYQMIIPL